MTWWFVAYFIGAGVFFGIAAREDNKSGKDNIGAVLFCSVLWPFTLLAIAGWALSQWIDEKLKERTP